MLFNSYVFIGIFLPIVLVGFYILYSQNKITAYLWLSMSSIFFYGYWNIFALPVLVTSVCFNYYIGLSLIKDYKFKSRLLAIAILVNLLILGYFKYTNFIIDNLNFLINSISLNMTIQSVNVELPIGISFFTFTQIVYLIDVYNGKTSETSFRKYFLFVTFFPQLIAGPFLHHKSFIPQISLDSEKGPSYDKFFLGTFIFSIGLGKKILIADTLGIYADNFFDAVYANSIVPMFFSSWLGSLAYTLQIYFDFSGYSDMALGLGLLFGIKLPINFNSPYKSKSIIDYWQRWHMTLTGYIGQYLFTPISLWFMRKTYGGNKLTSWLGSIFFPNMLVFFIIGVWHGASWTFIIWGLIHGLFLVINHGWRLIRTQILFLNKNIFNPFKTFLSWSITFISVNIAFVMFRAQDLTVAKNIYSGLFGFNGVILPPSISSKIGLNNTTTHWLQIESGSSMNYILSILIALFIALMTPNVSSLIKLSNKDNDYKLKQFLYSKSLRVTFAGIIFGLSLIGLNKVQTFLYFQF